MPFEVERILDANINRLTEGLRVIEDHIRFNSSVNHIFENFKNLRHKVISIIDSCDLNLLSNRFAENDHGRKLKGLNEYKRNDESDVFRANFKRAQESCRVIEETLKTISIDSAKSFEEIRYQLYDLEQLVLLNKPFPSKCLYALITQSLCKKDPIDTVKMIRDAGADIIQLREKNMEDNEFVEWARKVKEELVDSNVKLIINDKIHIAQLIDAAGVHLGQGDLNIKDAKKLLKPWQWVGRSTSALEAAKKAEDEGHTYIGVGPLFPTDTKKHRGAVGLNYINEVNDNIEIPYVSIGAINRDSIDKVITHNPKGIAVCTAIISADDPYKETLFYKSKIKK
jgi:thiamine-phosphate pyrophosphorylase